MGVSHDKKRSHKVPTPDTLVVRIDEEINGIIRKIKGRYINIIFINVVYTGKN